ncbi:hypothetical protein [Sandaracinus amylolyticus]|uniref:hypothetical protein n=1 Tax=Sandaracinus amylolyticus TaxID=927083 RepID=UPI001F2690B0|nr:hypothetical protein [Sandaracinus amylolyticus]UJR80900.1 Hypothetical protein I5071_29500 [Sandaracinus amylolyticus]
MSPESIVERVVARLPEAEIQRAQAEFHARTGPFAPGEPFYEERVRAFLDWLVIERHEGAAMRAFLPSLAPAEQPLARAMLASMRSLFRVTDQRGDDGPIVDCLLYGARFVARGDELPGSRLTAGDVLDGRAIGLGGRVMLAPGPVFHPREAHEALAALLETARAAGRCDGTLLDPLLRMRMRLDRFESIRAKHIYRFDALDRTEILTAPWAADASG